MIKQPWRIFGDPQPGGLMVIADHASNRVPDDIDLGIAPSILAQHIAVDIGIVEVAERMAARPGVSAFLANVSRLVADFNRDGEGQPIVVEQSDGIVIPGNMLDDAGRAERIARFYTAYHDALAAHLARYEPRFILNLHSFTPALASDPSQQRPWHVGVLYNEDARGAQAAIPLLEAEGLCVGDQLPYSGRDLNTTMNRHAEAMGRRYLGVEIRQDQIETERGQGEWAERLLRICERVMGEC